MPLYEYYCETCHGIFETVRPMREASEAMPCPECNEDAERIMSSFTAFTFREGYPRRLPDKGTYWHLGKEVKHRAKRMGRGYEHPELAQPKPTRRPAKGQLEDQQEKQMIGRREAAYRGRWGLDKQGRNLPKAAKGRKQKRRTI